MSTKEDFIEHIEKMVDEFSKLKNYAEKMLIMLEMKLTVVRYFDEIPENKDTQNQ